MAFVDGCDDQHPDKCRNVQLASVKLHKSNELGSDVYLMQGEECNIWKFELKSSINSQIKNSKRSKISKSVEIENSKFLKIQ